MELNLLDMSKVGCNLYGLDDEVEEDEVGDDELEFCYVYEYDENVDGFGDDEDEGDEDDCIVILLFLIGSVSFGLNEFMEYGNCYVLLVCRIFIDEMVLLIIYGNLGEVLNLSEYDGNFNVSGKESVMIFCLDIESVDEKGENMDNIVGMYGQNIIQLNLSVFGVSFF